MDEAANMGQSYIGTERRSLLGLIREGEGVAARVLRNLGVELDAVRKLVLQMLGGETAGQERRLGSGDAARPAAKAVGETPTLDSFGRDLTQLAREAKLDPVIGREKEIERVIQILSRRTKNNAVLVGDSGVGKTAIVEGLANRIVETRYPRSSRPPYFRARSVSVVAGSKYRGEFEDRLKGH